MREILFRGKRERTGRWVFGTLVTYPDGVCLICEPGDKPESLAYWQVLPQAAGQYTGMKDKNGNRIFEGDILEARLDDDYPENITRVVVGWEFNGWALIQHEHGLILTDRADDTDSDIWTVCGNIWDNPELIGGGENG